MIDIEIKVTSRASAHAIFRLLRDGATWPRWSLFDLFELEREGRHDPLGVGTIRVFSIRGGINQYGCQRQLRERRGCDPAPDSRDGQFFVAR